MLEPTCLKIFLAVLFSHPSLIPSTMFVPCPSLNRIPRLILQAILQLWAETCTPFLSDDIGQAFSSGYPTSTLNPPPTASAIASNISDPILSMPGGSYSTLPDGATQAQILQYFRDQLASLLSYDEVLFPNAFHAFNTIASANIGNSAGCALHCGILALASRHMFNNGQLCFERVSERLGVEGSRLIMQKLEDLTGTEGIAEEELITLLAGLLMLIMYKVSRCAGPSRNCLLTVPFRSVGAMCGVSKATSHSSRGCVQHSSL